MKSIPLKTFVATALMVLASASHSATWTWSFAGEKGTFTTAGNGAPGTYTVTDFSVLSSASGATLGSLSGGNYGANNLGTSMPYSFDWNGSQVTAWHKVGSNTFDWNIYQQLSLGSRFYFFGWDSGNVNNPFSAAYFDMTSNSPLSVGALTVAVPEPSSYWLMVLGLAGLTAWSRRHHKIGLPS